MKSKALRASGRQMGKSAVMMELRVRMLLRNGLVSKSGCTIADTEVLKEMAVRLGYDVKALATLDITDPDVNPFAKM